MITRPLFLIGAVALFGCTEPRNPRPAGAATPALEARLELADSTPAVGSSVVVRIRLNGASSSRVASFTGRVEYDTTALRYEADASPVDGATRVTNSMPGLVRMAAMSPAGFSGGLVAEYRFVVRDPSGVRRLKLGVDELHDVARVDVLPNVAISGTPALRVP